MLGPVCLLSGLPSTDSVEGLGRSSLVIRIEKAEVDSVGELARSAPCASGSDTGFVSSNRESE